MVSTAAAMASEMGANTYIIGFGCQSQSGRGLKLSQFTLNRPLSLFALDKVAGYFCSLTHLSLLPKKNLISLHIGQVVHH